MKKWIPLLGFIALALGIGGAPGVVIARSIKNGWYERLNKPKWTPPDGVFGPVWSILFALMGVAAWRVWRKRDEAPDEVRVAITLWGVQLILNAAWTVLFFGLRKPKWALVEIFALGASIGLTARALGKVDKTARMLFAPYILWTSFAMALNASIARRNED